MSLRHKGDLTFSFFLIKKIDLLIFLLVQILTDGSIVGKLRWEGVDKDTNEARQYERFFLCPSDIYQIRLAHWTSTTPGIPTTPVTNLMNILSMSSTRHRLSSPIYNDEQIVPATYR
jgi:hypothetical protein